MISIQECIYGNLCQNCFSRERVKEIKICNGGGGVIIRLCANCRAELVEVLKKDGGQE